MSPRPSASAQTSLERGNGRRLDELRIMPQLAQLIVFMVFFKLIAVYSQFYSHFRANPKAHMISLAVLEDRHWNHFSLKLFTAIQVIFGG